MERSAAHHIILDGRRFSYRLVRSRTARRLRVRVGPGGVEVVHPPSRSHEAVVAFLLQNEAWLLAELKRVERLTGLRRPDQRRTGRMLFRGEPTQLRVEPSGTRARGNSVVVVDGRIVVRRGSQSRTSPARSLETWLRQQARMEIGSELAGLGTRLRGPIRRVYVMDQRTKWGNCSSRGNLSFSWRLVLAPRFVLRYLVAHECVHLTIPDHSSRFWLTVQGVCPEAQRARQWLSRHEVELRVDLESVLGRASGEPRRRSH
jgi:predicted metal-dependent hydrolase